MFRLLLPFLLIVLPHVVVSEHEFDFVCGGTSYHETKVLANETIVIGEVPAGLHRLAIHLWSDEDMDIQIVSGDTTVIHWKDGLVYHGEEQVSSYNGDTFVYSGYNGNGVGPGNEFVIFDGFTSNDYKFLVYAKEEGEIKVRFGWIPIESCNITEKYYRNLDQLMLSGKGSTGGNMRRRRLQTKSALHDSIDGHTRISYTNCWAAIKLTDQNPSNSAQVIGIYSRKAIPKTYQDGSSTCGGFPDDCWNREHVYPKSRGDFDTVLGAGTDLHHLRAEDRSVNTQRNNKNFQIGGTVVPDCSICKQTSTTFEPPNVSKGAVARMMFYMDVRYNGDVDSNGVELIVQNGNPSDPAGKIGYLGDLAILKTWNNAYPPSAEEINRNNIIQSYYQGNRNPFIDNPGLANSLF